MSGMLSELRDLKGHELSYVGLGFLGAIGPGFLTLYNFHPELVKELDLGKLLLFSLSLTGPVIFFQQFIIFALSPDYRGPSKNEVLLTAAHGTACAMYPALLATYIFDLKFLTFLLIVSAISMQFARIVSNEMRKRPLENND